MIKGRLAKIPFILSLFINFVPKTNGNIAVTIRTGIVIMISKGLIGLRFLKINDISNPTRNQPKKFCQGISKKIPFLPHFQAPTDTAIGSIIKSNETRIKAEINALITGFMG